MIIIPVFGTTPPLALEDCMLKDLFVLSGYFDEIDTSLYEEDLVRRYGRDTVNEAIDNGWLLHGWIPCGRGRRRCVVRLSETGRAMARC